MHVWYKWRLKLFSLKFLPVNGTEPRVSLDIFHVHAIAERFTPQTSGWITFQELQEYQLMIRGMSGTCQTPLNATRPSRVHLLSASSGNLRWSREMECVRSELVLPLNGRRPNTSSYAHTPKDH